VKIKTSEFPLDDARLPASHRHQLTAQWESDASDMRTVRQQVHSSTVGRQGGIWVQSYPSIFLSCHSKN
jgi:hypothetical protein